MEYENIVGMGIGLAAVGVTAHLIGKMMDVTKTKHNQVSRWI